MFINVYKKIYKKGFTTITLFTISNTLRRSDEHETACGHNSGDAHSIESRRCKGASPNLSGKRTGSDAGGNPACAVTLHLRIAYSDY